MPNELLTACPVCHGPGLRDKLQVPDKSVSQETFTIQQCPGCGLLLTNPRPDAASIGRYYESADYVSHNSAAQGLVNQVYKVARAFTVRRKVKLITKLNSGQPGRLLDYGCGTGHFLAGAQRARWWVAGIEPNPAARAEAAARVHEPIKEPAELPYIVGNSYDVVTLWHVLEHIHTLNQTLDELLRVMRQTGKLLIAVPNAASADARHYGPDWAAYDVPRHLYHFVPATMRQLLSAHGLRITQTLPLPLDAYYISMLSERNRSAERAGGLITVLRAGYKSNQYAAQHGGQYSSLVYVAERAAAGR